MSRLALLLPCLSLLLLAAHSLRNGTLGLTAALIILAGLVWTRRGWVRFVAAAVLAWGFFVWVRTAVLFIRMRVAMDEEWTRLAVIMAALLAVTAIAMAVLAGNKARLRYSRNQDRAPYQALAFLVTAALLVIARGKVGFPILLSDRFFGPGGWGALQIFLHGVYATWLTGLVMDPDTHRIARPRLWTLFSAVFFLQLALGLTVSQRFLMTGSLHLPVPALIIGGPLYRLEPSFMVFLFLGTVVLVGPAWCSHLCYVGVWDDIASRLGPATSSRPRSAGRWVWLGRGISLALTVGLSAGLRLAGIGWPVALTIAALFGLGGVAVMAFVSRHRGSMIHCTAYCPMGLIANFVGRLSPWRMRMDEGCTSCGRCARACRYGALEPTDVARGRPGLSCTLCGECVPACKHGSMGYRLAIPGVRVDPAVARGVYLALVIGLHAAFLAVARI
ncbi:4Fe-4S binding protein [Oceanidesulfovibrio marinus]|uniref:4Fe-4S binding protein n=1 Tax=Oceanidesulfovibrio marinus TaxID=370038 RepID=A0ABX6NJZ4_9BACT|nr:4Fe-4S dicluster domain-containing protein [Oceanidesulfovibrio marinus]QJT10994.1 4Fe-4S binding protein [Oceanidesulfovibrio marinus]